MLASWVMTERMLWQNKGDYPLFCTAMYSPEVGGGHHIIHSGAVELQSLCENDVATPLLMRNRQACQSDSVDDTLLRRCFLDKMDVATSGEDTQSVGSSRRSGISTIGSPMSEQFSEWDEDVTNDTQEFSTDVSSARKCRSFK